MDLSGKQRFTLSTDTTDVSNDTKLDFSNCGLKGAHGYEHSDKEKAALKFLAPFARKGGPGVSDEEKAALKAKLPGCVISC